MFKWQEEVEHLGIPASRVLRLHRSLNKVQIALPGVPSQEASAYVCAFSTKSGLKVTIAMHLESSHRLAFFFHRNADSSRSAKDLMQEALDYAESMGFSLADTDYHLASESRREELWAECPLEKGPEKSETAEILEELDEVPEELTLDIIEEPEPDLTAESTTDTNEEPSADEAEIIEEVEETYEELEIDSIEEPSSKPEAPKELFADADTTQLSTTKKAATEANLTEHLGRLLASF